MKKACFFISILLLSIRVCSQNDFAVLKVLINDEQTGLSISNATLLVKENNVQLRSDQQGEIRMALEFGSYTFIVSHNDYQVRILRTMIQSDSLLVMQLRAFDKSIIIDEITIEEKRPLKNNLIGTGIEMLESATLGTIPAMGGEKDLCRSLALLPGIQTASEGSSNLVIRGGNPDQNLMLINDFPLYQTHHFFSMVSAVNPLLINQVQVYKSGFPANYGGKVSSVIKVTNKTSDNKKFHTEGDIGLLSSNILVSTPLVKDKLSVLICGRRTYLDLVARPFKNFLGNITFNFSDLYISADWKISSKNNINLFGYSCSDVYKDLYDNNTTGKVESNNIRNWDNQLSGLSWSYESGAFNNHFSAGRSTYQMNIIHKDPIDSASYHEKTLQSNLENYLISDRLNYQINKNLSCETGIQFDYFDLNPATCIISTGNTISSRNTIDSQQFNTTSLWLSANISHKSFDAQIGWRGSMQFFSAKSYFSSEPRIALKYSLSKIMSFKASYARMSQPLHLLSNNGLGLPVDLWIGPKESRQPIKADHWSIGLYRTGIYKNQTYELSIESYFKTTKNLISYLDGYNSAIFTPDTEVNNSYQLQDILTQGKGLSYGIELLIEKKSGSLTGWISYTWSKSLNAFNAFENGTWYNSNYDRPHNLSVTGSYKLKAGWNINFSFSLMSGQPFSFPVSVYPSENYNLINSKPIDKVISSNPVYIYDQRNNIRLKTFHKIDLGIKKQLKQKGRYNHWIEFSLYNAYNYPNSTYGELRDYPYSNRIEVVSVSLFPIIPGISYSFRF